MEEPVGKKRRKDELIAESNNGDKVDEEQKLKILKSGRIGRDGDEDIGDECLELGEEEETDIEENAEELGEEEMEEEEDLIELDEETDDEVEDIESDELFHGFLLASRVEEQEAEVEDADEAMTEYQLLCSELGSLIGELDEKRSLLKKEDKSNKEENLKQKEIELEGSLYAMQMRHLNRIEKIRTKNMRECLNKAKQQVDALQLQLENSLCEILHVRKEVDKCLHFKSRDQNIELVSVEEFYDEAPESLSCPESTRGDEHKLRLARLKWELEKRKELSSYYENLLLKQNKVDEAIKEKKSENDSLLPLFKDVLAVTKPMQDFLGVPNLESYGKHEAAAFLPQQLFLLYIQTDAYRLACDKNVSLSIIGEIDRAKEFTVPSAKESSEEESDSERKVPCSKKKKEKQKQLLVKHPLSVRIKIFLKGGDLITLEFSYLVNLNILTVFPTLELQEPVTNNLAKAVLSEEKILCELFAGDIGLESPNIVNYYQLRQVGLEKFDSKGLGLPYIWVQRLGGLDFAGNENRNGGCVEPKKEISLATIPNVIKEVRRRVRARLGLASQLILIGNGEVPSPENMRDVNIMCTLKSWEAITWDEYYKNECIGQLLENQYVSQCDLLYRAVFVRGGAIMTLLVAVKGCYPHIAPTFTVIIDTKEEVYTSLNNDNVRDIEAEINVYWKEFMTQSELSELWNYLLIRQTHRAMICFDIFLECHCPETYSCSKPLSQPFSREGTDAHPYKYVFRGGEGVFTQR